MTQAQIQHIRLLHSYRMAVVKDGVVVNMILAPKEFQIEGHELIPIANVVDQTLHGDGTYEEFPIISPSDFIIGVGCLWDGTSFSPKKETKDELLSSLTSAIKAKLDVGIDVEGTNIPATDDSLSELKILDQQAGLGTLDEIHISSAQGDVITRTPEQLKADIANIVLFRQACAKVAENLRTGIDEGTVTKSEQVYEEVERQVSG